MLPWIIDNRYLLSPGSYQREIIIRAVARALIGGGDVYSYICVLPD